MHNLSSSVNLNVVTVLGINVEVTNEDYDIIKDFGIWNHWY